MILSFDVKSSFTLIPQRLIEDTVNGFLNDSHGLKLHDLTVEDMFQLQTWFTFGDRIYEQTKGILLGLPIYEKSQI